MSDAQVGAAAMSGSPNSMFPKIPIPPAEVSWSLQIVCSRNIKDNGSNVASSLIKVGMGISALDERVRQSSLRGHFGNTPSKKV